MTLLAGGGSVYIYPDTTSNRDLAERIAIQRSIIEVVYPADETVVSTIPETALPKVLKAFQELGLEIVDTRKQD